MKNDNRFDNAVKEEQVRALYRQSPILYLGMLVLLSLVAGFLVKQRLDIWSVGWVASIILLTLCRTGLSTAFHRAKPQGEAVLKWGYVFAITSLFSGMLWGAVSLIFLDFQQIDVAFLIVVMLTGVCAAGLVPLSSFPLAYFGFCLAVMLPLSFTMFQQQETSLVIIGYIILPYITVLLGYCFVVNRNFSDSIKLRFENLELLDNLREQKDIAEKANADKSQFLAAASHDLRQPLHAMELYLDALANILTEDNHKELLDKSRQSSSALKKLLESIMDISRLDASSITINKQQFNLQDLFLELKQEYEEQARKKSINLSFRSRELIIENDKVLLGRIIRNLLSNSIAHSQADKILVSARKLGRVVRIEVRDNGCGIPSNEHNNVFSEFYQLKNPERDRNKGLGLGLAIVKRLSGILGLELKLRSEIEKGSCFSLTTEAKLSPQVEPDIHESVVIPSLSGLLVALVEDEVAVREAMSVLLMQWGCELVDGESFAAVSSELDIGAYPPPDLIISDYRLPNDDGLKVINQFRDYLGENIPALLITGDTDKAIPQQAANVGVSVLIKPVSPVDLHNKIAELLQ